MIEYIEREAAKKFIDDCLLREEKLQSVEKETLLAVKRWIDAVPPADVVSLAYLERYANLFCAIVTFPEFIREAKAFLKAFGGFQEGGNIYG